MYFLLISLFCITAVTSHDLAQLETSEEVADPEVEIVRELSDDEDILIRSRRSAKAEVCKYKKGNWSECDLTEVSLVSEMHQHHGACNTRVGMGSHAEIRVRVSKDGYTAL